MTEEVEDFEKVIKFDSNSFAIVDGNVAKALKDSDIPNAENMIFVPTKLSPEEDQSFKIVAKYDDARLSILAIKPANAVEAPPDIETINQNRMDEGVRDPSVAHGESDPVQKKLSQIDRKAQGEVPGTGDRSYRNKGDSAKGNPKTKLTPGVSAKAKISQQGSIKGARRSNYGQPKKKETSRMSTLAPSTLAASHNRKEIAIVEFLQKVKTKSVTEDDLLKIENKDELSSVLRKLRSNIMAGHSNNKSFEVVHEAIEILEEDRKNHAEDRVRSIEEMVNRGLNNLLRG